MKNLVSKSKKSAEKWSKKQTELKSSATRYDAFLEGVKWAVEYLSQCEEEHDKYVIVKTQDKTYQAFKKNGDNPNNLFNSIDTIDLKALMSTNAQMVIMEEELKTLIETIDSETLNKQIEIIELKNEILKLKGKKQ